MAIHTPKGPKGGQALASIGNNSKYVQEGNSLKVKIVKIHPDAVIPTTSYEGDVGYDVYAIEDIEIPYGYTREVKTGIAIQLPKGYYYTLNGRGSYGRSGTIIHRGVMDNGFRGEISVHIHNISTPESVKDTLKIKKGNKIAQITFHESITVNEWLLTDKLDESERGEKKHGSSGE